MVHSFHISCFLLLFVNHRLTTTTTTTTGVHYPTANNKSFGRAKLNQASINIIQIQIDKSFVCVVMVERWKNKLREVFKNHH